MSFVLAHVSDLHVSEFGDTFHDRLRIVKRSVNPASIDASKYDVVWEEAGWRVVHERGKRRTKIGLVDPENFIHPVPSVKETGGVLDPVERAAWKACRLEGRRAKVLAEHLPTQNVLRHLYDAMSPEAKRLMVRNCWAGDRPSCDCVCTPAATWP